PNTITDAITSKRIVRGPIADNQSNQNPIRDTKFAFGTGEALTVVGGHVYPVWSGNLNGGPNGDSYLHVFTAATTIAAGPRIVSSTMGPVGLPGDSVNLPAADGS